ncbi:ABC transporter permease [Lacicoccus alkaliphilus]|uniref:ABC-2 type transport system permease protein n=1 Tax=Lacicoccus alkaliphilus DSM 16010 TaxID=1123231 RepID=A0A1M7J5K2_9BACL|nr:ABC transporter permease [Salinicoccus alkaliphilus]SHM48198.1 ABC-2 type transport system permease protein [Salinicoccus alkaliphilus DSM 16010]
MNKFMTTFRHTYLSKVKAKSFIITTIIVMLLIILAGNFDKIMNLFDGSEEVGTIEVEASETFTAQFQAVMSEISDDIDVVDSGGDITLTVEETVPLSATVESDNEVNTAQQTEIEMALDAVNRQMVIESLDLSEEEANLMAAGITIDYDTGAAVTDADTGEIIEIEEPNYLNVVIFYITVFVMFFIVINYASQIGTEIAMEKSSRVIEMIVSSVSPVNHLFAKILAIICVSLTQLFFFVVTIIAVLYLVDIGSLISEFGLEANDRTVPMVVYSLIFLLLGLVLYLSVSALLGSFVSRMEDLQQALLPVTMMSLGGMYLGMFNLFDPGNLLVRITSYFPFFTPFVMPLRVLDPATSHLTVWTGILVILITIAVAVYFAARIYKGSILSTDQGIIKNIKKFNKGE